MAGGLGFIMKLLGTRAGAVAAVLVALLAWHHFDKSSAVRRAVVGYVADVELTAAQAQIEEAKRRRAITSAANTHLLERLQVAEGEAQKIAREIELYEAENEINPDGVVDRGLLLRLLGN